MERFFFGVSDGSCKLAIEMMNGQFDVMINYAAKVRSVPRNHGLIFLDSGGFCFFTKNFDYTTPHEHYLNFVRKKNVDFFANRDYPCEVELLRKRNTTVRENQLKTIENQLQIMELLDGDYEDLKDKFVAVLQGWKVDDYLWMLDYMREHSLLTKLIAIGSVCRRNQIDEIREIITTIRENLHRKYRLHAFGVKFSVLKFKDVWDALWSCDSVAYRYMVRKDHVENKPKLQILEKLEVWIKKLQNLQMQHTSQRTLDNYVVIV